MSEKSKNKERILIVDDSEMNRMILADMLEDQYEILEAGDGARGIAILQQMSSQISLVLLDIVMPEMDGFEVLAVMNQKKWIENVPVIMISAESMPSYVQRAYELGVTDYISRPFDSLVVQRRVINTIMLYAKQRKLIKMVTNQMYEKEKNASLMVTILSHIVEFRNGESGLHVLHIQTITELLLKSLVGKTDQYQLSHEDINMITMASALHDIGKIAIPSEVLNKPGRFTAEEYEVMKTHSAVGASMLKDLPFHQDELLVKVAYQICRWHHERYDGRGYPDGLKGEEIPISAQVVSMADVYDALTSERVYKKAFSHETALQMIQDGECGTFNPLLIECLLDVADSLLEEMKDTSLSSKNEKEMRTIVDEILHHEELDDSALHYLEEERAKYQFYASVSREIQFEYTVSPSVLTLTECSAQALELPEVTMEPLKNEKTWESISRQDLQSLQELLRSTTPENCDVRYKCMVRTWGKAHAGEIVCRAVWSDDEKPKYLGVLGKVLDDRDE